MIPRERFRATVHHQEPDRVPQLIRWGKEAGRKLEQIYPYNDTYTTTPNAASFRFR